MESNADSELICVEYPGTVKNDDKMIETLGGMNSINEAFSQSNRKLELKFRPNAPGCKPTCAEKAKTTSLLIKAKVMKNTKTGETKVVHEVVGPVESVYKFDSLCDFQYLPMVKKSATEYESIKDKVVIDHLPTTKDLIEEEGEKVPLYMPPKDFSRVDTVQDYHFRRETRDEKTSKGLPQNIIGRTRQRRSLHNCFVTFDAEAVPEKPVGAAEEQLKSNAVEPKHVEIVKSLFEEQKIWLRAELLHKSQVPSKFLKFILPVVSYYFSSGPWRNQWVKMGYDPRLDPEASTFQTLDYRLRFRAGIQVESKRKSSNWSRHKIAQKAKTSLITLDDRSEKMETDKEALAEQEEKFRDGYIFRPGRLPPSRQVFYQYRNIQVTEAQILIEKYRLASTEKCDEKNGWYKKGLDEELRNILAQTIKTTCVDDETVSIAATNATSIDYASEDSESE